MLGVEVSCFIVKWKLKLKSRRGGVRMIPGVSCYNLSLAFQGTEANFSSLLCCLYRIYKPVLHLDLVSLALWNTSHLLSFAFPTGRCEWLGGSVYLVCVAGISKGECFPFYHMLQGLHSPACVCLAASKLLDIWFLEPLGLLCGLERGGLWSGVCVGEVDDTVVCKQLMVLSFLQRKRIVLICDNSWHHMGDWEWAGWCGLLHKLQFMSVMVYV